jgi:hypothetical protein
MILSVSLLEFFRNTCLGVTLDRRCLRGGERGVVPEKNLRSAALD